MDTAENAAPLFMKIQAAKLAYGVQAMRKPRTIRTHMRVTSLSAFWVDSDSCCWAAAWGDRTNKRQSMKKNKVRPIVVHRSKMPGNMAYGFDGQHKTSISEKDEEDGNTEVAAEHVHHI